MCTMLKDVSYLTLDFKFGYVRNCPMIQNNQNDLKKSWFKNLATDEQTFSFKLPLPSGHCRSSY